MGQIILALIILGMVIVGAIYSMRSYNPHTDFNTWCVELQLLMHEKLMLPEAELFNQGEWTDAWYKGETPEQALNNRYGHNK